MGIGIGSVKGVQVKGEVHGYVDTRHEDHRLMLLQYIPWDKGVFQCVQQPAAIHPRDLLAYLRHQGTDRGLRHNRSHPRIIIRVEEHRIRSWVEAEAHGKDQMEDTKCRRDKPDRGEMLRYSEMGIRGCQCRGEIFMGWR